MTNPPKILLRMRPLLPFEDEPAWLTTSTTIECMATKSIKEKIKQESLIPSPSLPTQKELDQYSFNFENVISASQSSEKIYRSELKKLVEKSLTGQHNTTIVAYGQTCSGKTYTLLGVNEMPGVIPCIFRNLWSYGDRKYHKYDLKISYTEIYNEKLIDLLGDEEKELKIMRDEEWGHQIKNGSKIKVQNFDECIDVLDKGELKRKYGEKINHEKSSRSHTILTIFIERCDEHLKTSKSVINIVDLAGSERLTGNEVNTLETGHINKSLFAFSNVIAKLSQNKEQHIPYRDSKLTRLLEDSLTIHSNLAIIFCISPAVMNFFESVSTMRLAVKAKKIEIKNLLVDEGESEIKKYLQIIKEKDNEIEKLQTKISKMSKQISSLNQQIQQQIIIPKNHPQIKINALILLDHENFMLSIDDTIENIQNEKVSHIKQEFIESMTKVYEKYAESIVETALELKYEENWLKIEQISFVNLLCSSESLLKYRIPILKEVSESLTDKEFKFKSILSQYIEQISIKIDESSQFSEQRVKNTTKYCSESPIFEESTIELSQSNLNIGKNLLSWGCKKDGRVFKSDTDSILSETENYGNFKSVTCGAHYTLALSEKGEVFGWGKNEYKQICNSKNSPILSLRNLSFKVKIESIAAGWAHSLVLCESGEVYSFGFGEDGQLGHGDTQNLSQPLKIECEEKIAMISAGHSHSGLIDIFGNYYSFGFNKDYRLMIGESKSVNRPKKVILKGIIKAALGVSHTCLLSREGKIYCGGVGTNGELGIDLNPSITGYETISVPQKNFEEDPIEKICPIVEVDFFSNTKIIDISCGECMTGVITEKQELFTFGKTTFDRLGHSKSKPHKILENVQQVELGYRHGFAWNKQSKEVFGWGFNMYNQLGTLQPKDVKTPQIIHSLCNSDVIEIAGGFFHSAAITK